MLFFVVFLAALLRFQGLDWDQNQHLQPDERYISMVLSSLSPAKNFSEYLDPNRSPLSPYTHGFGAYIYGQLPLTALTYLSRWFGMEGYDKTYLLGRGISAMLDTLSIVLVYKLGRRLWNERVGVIGAGFYAFSPLAIQYSHFMVMESWVTFSWLMVILLLTRLPHQPFAKGWFAMTGIEKFRKFLKTVSIGTLIGVAMAVKASSVMLAPVVVGWMAVGEWRGSRKSGRLGILGKLGIIGVVTMLSFRFFQPTIFSSASWVDWSLRADFFQAFNFQKQAIEGKVMFPPQWQWVKTPRLWFPLKNMVLWGLGPVVGVLAIIGIVVSVAQTLKGRALLHKTLPLMRFILVAWIVAVFFWQGGQFVKTMRYFLPFFPLLALFAAHAINAISLRSKRSDLARSDLVRKIILGGSIVISGLWALMFTSIYRTTTTRIVASEWMYQNIPDGSKIMLEEWDDPLPLLLPGYLAKRYISAMEPVYTPDDEKKKMLIDKWTNQYDWIVLSSPRAKGSIGKLQTQFPLMSRFYKDLESGTLGFVKAAEFTSYPKFDCSWLMVRCSWIINDSSAEESFWVYDHPKVEIYQKKPL